ncbi:MAG: hypothetical protein LBQ86_04190 [Holophagales bacterium]|nr:hypothetical protein [Holophagales bacterium]
MGTSYTAYKGNLGAQEHWRQVNKTGNVIKGASIENKAEEIVADIVRKGLSLSEIIKMSGNAKSQADRIVWQIAIDIVRKKYPALFKGQAVAEDLEGGANG